ncbi:MAG: hypothetical protein WAP23_01030 [Candidatus Spechtbacterales bacterium]
MTAYRNTCPQCRADIHERKDKDGWYYVCLYCGWTGNMEELVTEWANIKAGKERHA